MQEAYSTRHGNRIRVKGLSCCHAFFFRPIGHAERDGRKYSMRFNSKAGNLIPKLLCGIAGVVLVAFFVLNRKGEELLPKGGTDKPSFSVPHQATPDKGTLIVDKFTANINSFPFSVSKPVPAEGTEEVSLHCYNVNVPLETGIIIDVDLKEPEGADLALGIFSRDKTLAYSNSTKNGGDESIRFVITSEKQISVAVETIAAPQTSQSVQYTLSVTSNPEEKGYIIESFPFTASRSIQKHDKIHTYQTLFPVENGTIVGAELKASEGAELALYILDENGILNYAKSKEKGEEEAALTFFNGGKASIIVEEKNRKGRYSPYALSVNIKGVEQLIETLPYTASGYMSQTDAEGEKWHWYQIASPVPAGTVISANLSVTGKANMDVTIFVDRNIISYGANHGIGENEHAELAIEKDSKVYVIIDNVEGEGNYSLTIISAVHTKP